MGGDGREGGWGMRVGGGWRGSFSMGRGVVSYRALWYSKRQG